MANFDERFSGLPVDYQSEPIQPLGNAPAEYSPWRDEPLPAATEIKYVPVDYDPFERFKKPSSDESFGRKQNSLEDLRQRFETRKLAVDRLVGANGEERFQTFPERIARSVGNVIGGNEAPYDPATGQWNVEGAMDVAGLMGGAGFAIKPRVKFTPVEGNPILRSDTQKPGVIISANRQVPAFYSAVEKAVESIQQPKMTGQQWLGTLVNKPGVKAEELWSIGLDQFLKENEGKVLSKAEVQGFVKDNGVKIQEVDKGKFHHDSTPLTDEQVKEYHDISDEKWNKLSEQQQERHREIANEGVAKMDQDMGATKYHNYQLPGSENYREKLFTLPIGSKNEISQRLFKKDYSELQPQFQDQVNLEAENPSRGLSNVYRSSHWDEPNVLAHVRMNDRTMQGDGFAWRNKASGNTSPIFATKEEAQAYLNNSKLEPIQNKLELVPVNRPVKSLHLEEIQSDWHQAGRNTGYKSPEAVKFYDDLLKQKSKAANELNIINDKLKLKVLKDEGYNVNESNVLNLRLTENQQKELTAKLNIEKQGNTDYLAKQKKFDDMNKEVEKSNPNMGVPDAPFKKSWHELALKRMVREAAEKGYNRLSWTPGEAQAARYDLSKQVDEVRLVPKNKNTDPAFEYRVDAFKNGERVVTKAANNEKDVADIVGKEVAKKLFEENKDNKGSSLKGQQLSIGGEGMKGFYDKIIPNSLSRITGEKVKTTTIKTKNTDGVSGEQVMNDLGIPREQQSDYWRNLTQPQRDKLFKQYRTKDQHIHYIDITPALRDKALKQGFPLFSSGVPVFSPVQGNPHNE